MAEAELNLLIKRCDDSGRQNRVSERYDWYNGLAKKTAAFTLVGESFPRTVSDTLIEQNEKETGEGRGDKGRRAQTAFYLLLLYRASPGAVRAKIDAELMLGKSPYLAAGIRQLSATHWRVLQRVVRKRGFPRNLVMKSGSGYLRNWDVIKKNGSERS